MWVQQSVDYQPLNSGKQSDFAVSLGSQRKHDRSNSRARVLGKQHRRATSQCENLLQQYFQLNFHWLGWQRMCHSTINKRVHLEVEQKAKRSWPLGGPAAFDDRHRAGLKGGGRWLTRSFAAHTVQTPNNSKAQQVSQNMRNDCLIVITLI